MTASITVPYGAKPAKPVDVRYPVDLAKAARVVNDLLDDDDPKIRLRAASIAVTMGSQNQRDEQFAEEKMDESRTRILALIARGGAVPAGGVIERDGAGDTGSGVDAAPA